MENSSLTLHPCITVVYTVLGALDTVSRAATSLLSPAFLASTLQLSFPSHISPPLVTTTSSSPEIHCADMLYPPDPSDIDPEPPLLPLH